MPAPQRLRFEDLLKAQERMAVQGDKSAAANLQRLQEMERTLKADHEISKQDKVMQAVQTFESVQADKDDDRIVVATEKTAKIISELNNNIIKLTDAIKKSTRGEVVDNDPAQGAPTTGAERVKQATQEVDTARVNVKSPVERFKELGTLKGFFDTSGPSRGMLDDIIRRRIEKTEYVKTQQEVGGATKAEASERFEQTDKLKKEAEGFKSQIEGYKKQGVSDEQLEKTDAYKKLKDVENKIIAADPLLRERVSPKEQPPQAAVTVNNNQRTSNVSNASNVANDQRTSNVSNASNVRTNTLTSMVAAAGATPASFQAPLTASREATTNLLGGAEEQQAEQDRMFQEEIDILKQIEENTRGLSDIGENLKKLESNKSSDQGSSSSGGIVIPPVGPRGSPKPGAPKPPPGAPKPGAPKPPPGAPKPGAPKPPGTLGKVANTLSKAKGVPILGTALAVGAGAYSAYEGYTSAGEEEKQKLQEIDQLQASGEIDEQKAASLKQEVVDTTDVKQSESVGGGVGMAGGAILGATAGAKIGGTLGTFVGGPVGTVIGGALGAATGGLIGAVSGTKVGKDIGRWGAKGWQATRDFFGGKKDQLPVKPTQKSIEVQVNEADFMKNDPEGFNEYKKFKDEQSEAIYKQIKARQKKKHGKKSDRPEFDNEAREEANTTAKQEAAVKFKDRIEAAKAGYVKETSAGGQSSDTSTGSGKLDQLRTDYQKADIVAKESKDELKSFEETAGPQVKVEEIGGFDVMGYKDPEKQAQFEKLKSKSYYASKDVKSIVAKSKSEVDGVKGNNLKSEVMAIKALKTRFGYTDDQLQSFGGGPTKDNFIQVGDKKYSPQVVGLYNKLVEEDLKVPTATPEVTADRSRIKGEQSLESQAAKVSPVAPVAPTPVVGEMIYNQSEANAAAAVPSQAAAAPVVINAPTNVQQTSNYGAKSPPRNTESSYQQYNRSKY